MTRMLKHVVPLIGLFTLVSINSYSWNAQGHQLIAQIALMQLTPQEKKQLNQYNRAYQEGYQPHSLSQAAVWLDWLHCKVEWCKNYRYYHYIDYPYSIDGTQGLPPRQDNALVAIKHATAVLKSPTSSLSDKGLQLRVLMHVIGDIHQPLHTISLFSQQFPQGDQGGNRFLLGRNRIAPQLHAYWDRGGGSLTRRMHLKTKAKQLLKRYPCREMNSSRDPLSWINASYHLAQTVAYNIRPLQQPSRAYQHEVRQTTAQQLAFAGCRLARSLRALLPVS